MYTCLVFSLNISFKIIQFNLYEEYFSGIWTRRDDKLKEKPTQSILVRWCATVEAPEQLRCTLT